MSDATLDSISARLRASLLHAAWSQWTVLGLGLGTTRACRSIVDPEALVLASLWLQPAERRLGKVLSIWAYLGSRQLSVQRIKNLRPDYPEAAVVRLAGFAQDAVRLGKDARWKELAEDAKAVGKERWKEATASPRLLDPAALMLRLRLGLGVGIKADVLSFLLGSFDHAETVAAVTQATRYQNLPVRRALEDLAAARLIEANATSPVSYLARASLWGPLLGLPELPLWRYWHPLFVLGAALDDLAVATRDRSRYIQSSKARDLMERHRRAFELNAVSAHNTADGAGEAYLDLLATDVEGLAERIEENFV